MSLRLHNYLVTFFCLSCLFIGKGVAQVSYSWNGSVSSDWAAPGNWTPSGVPGTNDTAIIVNVGNSPAISANTTVSVFSITSNTLTLNGNTLTANNSASFNASTITSGSLQMSGSLIDIETTTMNSVVTAVCQDIFINGSTFNQTVNATKTGSNDNYNSGGNSYNSDFTLAVNSSGEWVTAVSSNDNFNGNIIVNSTGGSGGLYLGYNSQVILATGKTISIGTQFDNCSLYLENFIQQGSVTQSLALGMGANLELYNCQFNGPVNFSAGRLGFYGNVFNGLATLTQNGGTPSGSSGNIFNAPVELIYNGGNTWEISYNTPDVFNDNIIVDCSNPYGEIEFGNGIGTIYLALGKTITVGSGGYHGFLGLYNFVQRGNTPQSLNVGNTIILADALFNGTVNITAGYINSYGSVYNAAVTFSGSGSGNSIFGGDTFNAPTEFIENANGGFVVSLNTPDVFNSNIILDCPNNGEIQFGSGGDSTAINPANLSIGSLGFSGTLELNNIITPLGSAFTLNLPSSKVIINGSNFKGSVNVNAGYATFTGSLFKGVTIFTQAGGANISCYGNTYYAPVTLNNNGVGGWFLSAESMDVYNSDVTFTNTGNGIINSDYQSSAQYKGNITINQGIGHVNLGYNQPAIIDGNSNQKITSIGSAAQMNLLTINKPSGAVNLAGNITIGTNLNLQNGIINCDSNVITFSNGATVTGASSNSFISGAVQAIGNNAFTFPIGNGTDYQPLSITAPANAIDAYKAQYIHGAQTLSSTLDTGITNLSNSEYWTLNRTSGTDNVYVTLGWNASSTNVATNISDMRIAIFDTLTHKWTDLGGVNPTGNSSVGTITSSVPLTYYGTITLAQKVSTSRNLTWNGSASSSWVNPLNWTPNFVPTINDNVTIVNATNQPIDSNNMTVNSLTITGGTLDIGSDTFTVTQNLNLGGGTITDGILNVIGNVNVNAATTIDAAINISANLNLSQGILTSTTILSLSNTSTVTGGSVNSFVNGAVLKVGHSAFTFPIGSGADFQPLTITAPVNITDSFAAIYYNTIQTLGFAMDNSITNLNSCENWYLYKGLNSSKVSVTLGWNGSSCNVTSNINNMVISGWNGSDSAWKNLGGVAAMGTQAFGTVKSAAPLVTYGPLTLANATPCGMTIKISSDTGYCVGGSTTLFASGGESYSWSPTTGLSSNSAPNPFVYASTTTTYTVTISSSSGCTQTATVTVSVNPLPKIIANVSSNTICLGNSVTLSGTGAVNYSWTGGVTNGNAFVPSVSGTYTVTGSTDLKGCVGTTSVSIVVNPNPVVGSSASTNSICTGASVILSGSGTLSYGWSGSVTDGQPFTPSVSNTYTVTGTDVNGCTATSSQSVIVKPVPNIYYNASAGSVCAGGSVTLSGRGATSYAWTGGVTDSSAFAPASTSTYTVTGTNSYGCTGSNSVTITVNPVPIAMVGTNATICQNTAVSINASGGTNYLWSPVAGLSDYMIAAPTATPESTTTYTVSVSNGTCSSTSSVTITVTPSPIVSITVNPSVTITPDGNSNTIYLGHGAQSLTLTATVDASTISYSWTPTQGLSCTNCLVAAVSPTSATTYTFTAVNGSGCTTTTSVTINVVTLGASCTRCQ
jgi:hypothetical protein